MDCSDDACERVAVVDLVADRPREKRASEKGPGASLPMRDDDKLCSSLSLSPEGVELELELELGLLDELLDEELKSPKKARMRLSFSPRPEVIESEDEELELEDAELAADKLAAELLLPLLPLLPLLADVRRRPSLLRCFLAAMKSSRPR